MSYDPVTDFLGLLRQTSAGVAEARAPGLDYVVAALARAGLIRVSVGQTAPVVNQPSTAWFKTALPSWTAEGVLFLWNPSTGQYELATPALWTLLFASGSGYSFQSAGSPVNVISSGVSLLAIQRASPVTTTLVLPSLASQQGKKIQIVDFSTNIVVHTVTLTIQDGSTIMQRPTWALRSTPDSLAGVMLQPSTDLNAWVIAP